MTEIYTVKLEQIASRGSILFETNFGLSFIADRLLVETKKSRSGRILRETDRKEKVISVLSYCCQYAYDKTPEGYLCKRCGARTPLPEQYVVKEYPHLEGDDVNALEQLVYAAGLDSLDSALIGDSLAYLLMELWKQIDSGARTREILKNEKFNGVITL